MANTKTTAKSTKKVEEVKNVEEKVIEKGEEKSIDEVSILKQQLEEMKKAMESLMNNKPYFRYFLVTSFSLFILFLYFY